MRIFYTPEHLLHDTNQVYNQDTPIIIEEIPERAETIRMAIEQAKLGPLQSPTDHGIAPIQAVHSTDFLEFLQHGYQQAAEFRGQELPLFPETFATREVRRPSAHPIAKAGYYCFGTYSPILAGTWQAAYWSAQCALSAAHDVANGARATYALCRPPGHHAAADLYGGFCYLNNAAIAARSLGERVAILDIDFHHGNGTQEIFYSDPGVLYCSLHADPDQEYPYFWGSVDEKGESEGLGYNCNYPLPLGCDDAFYLQTLEQALQRIRKFEPRYLVVSLGLDIIQGDEVGGFNVTPAGIDEISRQIAALRLGDNPLPTVIVQEGGYLLSELGDLVVRFLKSFE